MQDIYFEENYGKLYEKVEHGKSIMWQYDGPEGAVSHMFIEREIPGHEQWHDIVTPYGYGGPVIKYITTAKEELISAFYKAFSQYCFEHNIISEFIRFHPIADNALCFKSIYELELNRYTVGTNLKRYEDPFKEEFSKGCRKNIKQAVKKGISWRVTPRPDHIESFKAIYYSTMNRNNALDYYYFDDEYFSNCQKYFHDYLLFVEAIFGEKTIAAGLYFIYDKTIHIHLSGTLTEYLYLSPAYILRYATMLWGKENGYELIHHGGGRSNAEDDSLFVFKKQFGKNTEFPFYVGRRIWNQEVYDKLCAMKGIEKNIQYFPAYRDGEHSNV